MNKWYNEDIINCILKGDNNMLFVVIFICAILIGCNAFYNLDETEEKDNELNQRIKKH